MGRRTRRPRGPGRPPEQGPSPGPCGRPCSPQGGLRVSWGRRLCSPLLRSGAARSRAGGTAGQPQASAAAPRDPGKAGLGPRRGMPTPAARERPRWRSWTREASRGRDEGKTGAGGHGWRGRGRPDVRGEQVWFPGPSTTGPPPLCCRPQIQPRPPSVVLPTPPEGPASLHLSGHHPLPGQRLHPRPGPGGSGQSLWTVARAPSPQCGSPGPGPG